MVQQRGMKPLFKLLIVLGLKLFVSELLRKAGQGGSAIRASITHH